LADKRTIYYKHRELSPVGVALTAAAGAVGVALTAAAGAVGVALTAAAGAVGAALTIVVIVGIGIGI
jgi:hypothetical protein